MGGGEPDDKWKARPNVEETIDKNKKKGFEYLRLRKSIRD